MKSSSEGKNFRKGRHKRIVYQIYPIPPPHLSVPATLLLNYDWCSSGTGADAADATQQQNVNADAPQQRMASVRSNQRVASHYTTYEDERSRGCFKLNFVFRALRRAFAVLSMSSSSSDDLRHIPPSSQVSTSPGSVFAMTFQQECAICFEPMVQEKCPANLRKLNCPHSTYFHKECILIWEKRARSCPICRTNFRC
eukprot:CFRG6497T1